MVELIKQKNYKKKKGKKGRFGGPVKALSDGRPCIPPSASVQNRKVVRRHQKKIGKRDIIIIKGVGMSSGSNVTALPAPYIKRQNKGYGLGQAQNSWVGANLMARAVGLLSLLEFFSGSLFRPRSSV